MLSTSDRHFVLHVDSRKIWGTNRRAEPEVFDEFSQNWYIREGYEWALAILTGQGACFKGFNSLEHALAEDAQLG